MVHGIEKYIYPQRPCYHGRFFFVYSWPQGHGQGKDKALSRVIAKHEAIANRTEALV